MGDRTYISITFATKDQERVDAFIEEKGFNLGHEWGIAGESTVTYSDSEANYGGDDYVSAFTGAKINFEGYHAEGGTYGSSCFSCFDGVISQVCCDHDAVPAVPIGPDLKIPDAFLKPIKLYYELLKKFQEYSKEEP